MSQNLMKGLEANIERTHQKSIYSDRIFVIKNTLLIDITEMSRWFGYSS